MRALRPQGFLQGFLALLSILLGPGLVVEKIVADDLFVDRTEELGVAFEHRVFAGGEKYMPENMGSGLAIFDADGDGRLDLFFVQGAPVAEVEGPGLALNGETLSGAEADTRARQASPSASKPLAHRLFRQREDGRFEDVSQQAGFDGSRDGRGVGMGVCFGDVDRDGDFDLYVTHYGRDVFYRNIDGRFVDVSDEVGLGKRTWSTGCAFFDADDDGDLDLYVSSYVDFSLENHKYCGNAAKKLRSYCHPDVYGAVADAFYINRGDRFESVGEKVGIVATPNGKGLGVAAGDFDGDGDQDVLVANDSTMNELYLGDGRGRFEESALFAGLGLNGAGGAEASMGIVIADLDEDLRADVLLTHLDLETNTFYRHDGEGLFTDKSDASGLGPPSLPWVGFGVAALDVELDGDLDVAVVNGHIIDNIELFDDQRQHRQPAQFFRREKGRFKLVQGALPLAPLVGRGLLAADLDRDGDEDLVVTQNGGPALVLINKAGNHGASVTLRFAARDSAPHGFGAQVVAKIGARRILRQVPGAGSYLSQGPPEIVIGLGKNQKIDELEVRWPSGTIDHRKAIDAGAVVELEEPEGPNER